MRERNAACAHRQLVARADLWASDMVASSLAQGWLTDYTAPREYHKLRTEFILANALAGRAGGKPCQVCEACVAAQAEAA